MTETMLALGDFRFSLATAAFEEISRSTGWEWAEQNRIGITPVLQYTGKNAESITLPGRIYPHFAGGLDQVTKMREMADKGEPLLLVAGTGTVLGEWVITSLEETGKTLWANGVPRLIEFKLSLKRYS